MLRGPGLLKSSQHCLGLVPLYRCLTCDRLAFRFHCLHEGSIGTAVFFSDLITRTRALIETLFEEAITQPPGLLPGRDRTSLMPGYRGIGKYQGCGLKQQAQCNRLQPYVGESCLPGHESSPQTRGRRRQRRRCAQCEQRARGRCSVSKGETAREFALAVFTATKRRVSAGYVVPATHEVIP